MMFLKFWMQFSDSVNWDSSTLNETKPLLPWHFPPAQLRIIHEVQPIVTTKTNTEMQHLQTLTFSSTDM